MAGFLLAVFLLYRNDPFLEQHSLMGPVALTFAAGGVFVLVDRGSNVWLPAIYSAIVAVVFLTPFLAGANNSLLITVQTLVIGMTFVAAIALAGALAVSIVRRRTITPVQYSPARVASSLTAFERKVLIRLSAATGVISMFWSALAKILAATKS